MAQQYIIHFKDKATNALLPRVMLGVLQANGQPILTTGTNEPVTQEVVGGTLTATVDEPQFNVKISAEGYTTKTQVITPGETTVLMEKPGMLAAAKTKTWVIIIVVLLILAAIYWYIKNRKDA